jgi:hypothetical protein
MEPEIFKVATKFAYEANKLNARKEGCDLTLHLRVASRSRYDSEGAPEARFGRTWR